MPQSPACGVGVCPDCEGVLASMELVIEAQSPKPPGAGEYSKSIMTSPLPGGGGGGGSSRFS